jgi:hypothetical protein
VRFGFANVPLAKCILPSKNYEIDKAPCHIVTKTAHIKVMVEVRLFNMILKRMDQPVQGEHCKFVYFVVTYS